jgi:hypothetical protein
MDPGKSDQLSCTSKDNDPKKNKNKKIKNRGTNQLDGIIFLFCSSHRVQTCSK